MGVALPPVRLQALLPGSHREREGIRELDGFIARCRPALTLVDVGAHFGIFALAALHYGGPEARCYAFDPSPMAEHYLTQSATERLFLAPGFPQGRGRRFRSGTAFCAAWPLRAGYYSVSDAEHGQGERIRTPCRSLDTLLDELKAAPTHVKIDVEGFEWEVLQGARKLFTRSAPLLFLEIHNELLRSRGLDPACLTALLNEYGYHRVAVVEKASRARREL